jgi:hypothetical protein
LLWSRQMTNFTHNCLLYIYFNSLHVSSNPVLIIRTVNCINTTFGICHSVYCRWPFGVQVGKELSYLHTKRLPTQSDIYQMLYWYNWLSWWAQGCSKHVENWNKYTEKNCASSWSFTKIKADWLSTPKTALTHVKCSRFKDKLKDCGRGLFCRRYFKTSLHGSHQSMRWTISASL